MSKAIYSPIFCCSIIFFCLSMFFTPLGNTERLMIITHRLYLYYITPTFFFLLNINIQFCWISRLMQCDLWRRSRGKKWTRKYDGDYDDDSVVVVFRLVGDDDGADDDDDEKEEWRGWQECAVRGEKKIGMFGDRSIGHHALMKQNDRKRGWPR